MDHPAPQQPDPRSGKTPETKTSAHQLRHPSDTLPAWKVLLHTDSANDAEYAAQVTQMITHLPMIDCQAKVEQARRQGVSLLLTTHQERAELYLHQFAARNLTVSIEPA